MPLKKQIIVLANSIKHWPGVCIAGREILSDDDGYELGNWIRPVSEHGEGELAPSECLLTNRRAPRVLDFVEVPLNNSSQLAGFAKRDDLAFFLKDLCDVDYIHIPELAPSKNILDAYKKHNGDWNVYEREFIDLMVKRAIEKSVPKDLIDHGCLLCSEHLPKHCHRRLVVEYLAKHWGEIRTEHLT